ncbi:hypothetical protein ABHC79_01070, partial [Parabacteroides distasonis]
LTRSVHLMSFYIDRTIRTRWTKVLAITWIKNKKTSSNKRNSDLKKAEIFLRIMSYWVDNIEIVHWDNKNWGEIPSDFGNK